MEDINIKAVLGIHPKVEPHKFLIITRGASISIPYIVWFDYKDLAQLIFTFKQGRELYWFRMFDYLARSADTTVVAGKTYYNNIRPIAEDSKQCVASIVSDPTGNPNTAGYYEIVDPTDHQNDFYYMLDEHFCHEIVDEDHEYISFILSSEETKKFKPTGMDPTMLFEVTIKFNTDTWTDLTFRDSVIVEPQHPIAVVDSLYSQIK